MNTTPQRFCWNELASRDADAAIRFYTEVFGWRAETVPVGPTTYTTFFLGDEKIGGTMQMTADWGDTRPHWMPYIAVDDVDATAAKVAALGGKVCVPPTDIPPGRFALVEDPQGAYFSIIRFRSA